MVRLRYAANPEIVTSHNLKLLPIEIIDTASRKETQILPIKSRSFTQQCVVNSIAAFFKPQGPYLGVTI